jgi:hypothetical protein
MIKIEFIPGQRIYFALGLPQAGGSIANLTGYTAKADIRKTRLPVPRPDPVPAPLDTLTTANGRVRCGNGSLVVSGENVNVEVDVPGSVTAGWQFDKAYTDLVILQPNGEVYRSFRFSFEYDGGYTA